MKNSKIKTIVFVAIRPVIRSNSWFIFVAISILFVGISGLSTVHAVSAGLGVSSALKDIEVPVGSSINDSVSVFNNSTSTPLPISIDLLLWNLKEDADDIEFIRAEEGLNATKWFNLETVDIILEPGEARTINYTISPPRDVSPGSYFVMMRFQPSFPEFYFEEEGPRFIPEVGTLFFIKVPLLSLDGEAQAYGADIVSIEATGANKISIIDNFMPKANAGVFDSAVRTLVARIRNTGIFHFKASGSVEIKNIFGRVVAQAELPGRYLMPDRERPLDIIVLPPPMIDESMSFFNRAMKKIGYSLKTNTYFGPYKAVATLSVPNNIPVVKSVNFWVIPWQFWLIVGVGVTGLILFLRRFRGRVLLALRILLGRNRKLEIDDN